ncbi:MAG: 50S ribosomal protein L28 [Deltaproteobacteria bacterium]|nr:50S ribosomal protein L28 [Deltaproteobacteria bacterium]
MAYVCEICGKNRSVANNVSHSHIKTKRVQKPNLQRVKAVVDGHTKHIMVCTRCLRSGKVVKAI